MPGLTPFDINNLNEAISGVGQGFAQRRAQSLQAKHLDIQAAMRQRMLDAEERRMTAEEGRQNVLQQQLDLKDKQEMLQNGIALNAGGQMDDSARDNFNQWLSDDPHFGVTGIQLSKPPQKAPPQAGQSAVAQTYQKADEFRSRAASARAQGAGNYDPDQADRWDSYAENLEKWAGNQAEPKAEKPVKIGEEPIPAPPGSPIGTPTGKRYIYGNPSAPAAAAPAPASPKVLDVNTARTYLQKAGGDKNLARQMAVKDGYTIPQAQ